MGDTFFMELVKIQERIRESIRHSGLQQKAVAAMIGVSPQTVSKYMQKDIFPALDTLAKLCKALEISADYILGINNF